MGSKELRSRKIWQDYSGANATNAEKSFFSAFQDFFEGTSYQIRSKPKEFNNIYTAVEISPEVLSEIYCPPKAVTKHGISPDYGIDNLETKKTLYVEVKRQDGWVEGGKRSDGRGNAHERSCKYFTPGLLEILRNHGGIQAPALPFWTVFQGDITRDPCRVREVALWYKGFEDHIYLWRNTKDATRLIQHFVDKLSPLLD